MMHKPVTWLVVVDVTEAVCAIAMIFAVVEWKCLCWNYGRTLRQPHYTAVGWCCCMVSACCHVEKMGKIAGPTNGNRSLRWFCGLNKKYNEPVSAATLAVFATVVAMSLGLAVGDTVRSCEVACCVYGVACFSHCRCDCHCRHLNYGRTTVQSSWQFDDLDDCCVER